MSTRSPRNLTRAAASAAALAGWLSLSAAAAHAADGPSLDELLGLPPAPADAAPSPTAPEPGNDTSGETDNASSPDAARPVELDPEVARRLRGEAMSGNPFEAALVDMTEASERLGKAQDPGLTTQRLMQDALDKLDQAIAAAKRQQGGGSAGEPSPQRGEDAGGGQLAQQQSRGRGSAQPAGPGENSGQASPGGPAQVAPGDEPLAESRREWGSLPPRVRRELAEGVNERISPTYRRLTERYFQALSEER